MLDGVQPLAERVDILARQEREAFLGDDRAGVDALVHEVDGNAGLGHTRLDRLLDRPRACECGQQRGVDVDDAAGKAVEETPA